MSQPIILFDGDCGFCSRLVTFVVRRDPGAHFLFAPLQSEVGRQILTSAGMSTRDFATLVLSEGGTVFTKSTAALRIAGRLQGAWRMLRFLRWVPRPVRDFFYDLVARNRFRLGSSPAQCLLPAVVAPRVVNRLEELSPEP